MSGKSRLEEIDKKWELTEGGDFNCGDIYYLYTEVHRLRAAIEKAYKGCNHPDTIKILRDALNGEE